MDRHDPKASGPGPQGARLLAFRAIAAALPFLALGLLEGAFRIADAYGPTWENPNVAFKPGTQFFPEWKKDLVPKPSGTFRIFALGGSSTMGFGVTRPFAQVLEERLAESRPGPRWQVVNGGMGASGSHRVFEVMKKAGRLEPDLFLLYIGHNEFLEEVFYDPGGLVGRQQRLALFLRSFHVVNWLNSLVDLAPLGRTAMRKARLDRQFLGSGKFPLIKSPEQYRARLAFLASNLELMIEYCRAHGVPVVVVAEVPNLMWPPGNSVHGPRYAARAQEWDRLLEAGKAAADAKRYEAAVASLSAATAIDGEFAEAHHRLGRAFIGLGRKDDARRELLEADLLDRRGLRSNTEIVETMRDVCRRSSTPFFDAWGLFHDRPWEEYGPFGDRLFIDHCHPTEKGHDVLAEGILEFLAHASAEGALHLPASARPAAR